MNYKTIYTDLIKRAKDLGRTKSTGVYEAHHIIPKSFGGKGDCRNINHPNIVLLTPREHYIAHLLLTAIYPESPAMHKALWNMCNVNPTGCRYKIGSRMYNHIRTEYIKTCSGSNNHFYGKVHSEESKKLISLASLGRKANLGKKHTNEAKEKIAAARKGTTLSIEARKKISIAGSGGNHYNAKPIVCLKTGMIFGSGKELSEFLNIPFSTIRAYLNGSSKAPTSFHYKRV